MAPLTADQEAQFEELGYVLVDIECSAAWLDSAEETWDRLTMQELAGTHSVAARKSAEKDADEGYLALISHPYLEEVAKQMLRSPRVRIIEDGPHVRPPQQPGPAQDVGEFDAARHWENGCHMDWQVSESNFTATPRLDLLAIWIWLNDVPQQRAAMRVLPGSHRPVIMLCILTRVVSDCHFAVHLNRFIPDLRS
jgi:hypothetical protein